MSGFQMAGQIRDTLGDYHNQAPAIKELRDRLGAAFPAWRLGIVPKAMTKALREQPGAFKMYARANQVVSDDVANPVLKTGLDFGAPPEDEGAMIFDPLQYIASPASSGVAGILPMALQAKQQGRMLGLAGQEALRMVPFGSVAGGFSHFPYPTNAPNLVSGLGGAFGIYLPNEHTRLQREKQLITLGFSEPERIRILQSEGYIGIDWSRP